MKRLTQMLVLAPWWITCYRFSYLDLAWIAYATEYIREGRYSTAAIVFVVCAIGSSVIEMLLWGEK